MTGRYFVDSNVWIYQLSDDEPAKKERAGESLASMRHKVISWQVVNEVCANLIRKKGRDEVFVRFAISFMLDSCELAAFSQEMLENASDLRARHSVSFWDSLVVAAALEAGCDFLVSEDMQDGKRFGALQVKNLFAC
ncbi:MAG: PIN domain-containing protein [Opitutaceae bacterium]|jgi:predicted nucleic acid-binding protein|nr:PIN domain-containing protein [Opitutaceae bacterium]